MTTIHITFTPQVRPEPLVLEKQGDTLIFNGEALDFSVIPDGATLPADPVDDEWIFGDVRRIDGDLHLNIVNPYSGKPAAPEAKYPQPISIDTDGPVPMPPFAPEPEPEPEATE